jgi:hypothetical protein
VTLWDLVAVAFQRRWLTLCCVLLTGLAVYSAAHVQPLYFSQVNVVLLRPASVPLNAYTRTSQSLIDMAGVVARAMTGGGQAQTVSDGVTLPGEGIRSGYAVQQPNAGGQWQWRFDDPILDIQAVGPTRESANGQMQLALDEVDATLIRTQDAQGVAPENRVRAELSPSVPQLYTEVGSKVRAVATIVLLGLLITLALMGALGPKRPPGAARIGSVPPQRARVRETSRA